MDETLTVAQATVAESTNSFLVWLKSFLTWDNLFKLIGALVIIFVLWLIRKLLLRSVRKVPSEKISAQRSMIITKFVNYAFYIVFVMYLLSLFGVKLSAVLGAAGIAGVAIGFAAQTSVSNLISGIFVLSEGIMQVGDFITIDGVTGTVDSVDLLSVKIHTSDNQLIRIPNSTVINSNLTNVSSFPRRRFSVQVAVGYSTDLKKALEVLKTAPSLCPTVLKDPEPVIWIDSFGESGINITLAVWFNKADFLQTKNDTFIAVKTVLDKAKIEIPFNKLDVSIIDSTPKKAIKAKKK